MYDKKSSEFAAPTYSFRLPLQVKCHFLSNSNKSSCVVSGIVVDVMANANNEAYPLITKISVSELKLNRTAANKAPILPKAAETPWHIVLISVGKISAGIKKVVALGPH